VTGRIHVDIGVQFHLPTMRDYRLPDLVRMTERCADAGVEQIWVTDNLETRNVLVVLTAVASRVPIKLGTAVLVQYFHSQLAAAGGLAAITELMDGRELTVGMGQGSPRSKDLVRMPQGIAFMRQATRCLRQLLAGERVDADQYPLLSSYFHYAPRASLQLDFTPAGPVKLYGGGNGPKGLAIAGEMMDGVIFSSMMLPVATVGRLRERLDIADDAARRTRPGTELRRVLQVKVSVSRNGEAALDFARRSALIRILNLRAIGFGDDDVRKLGLDPRDIARIAELRDRGTPMTELRSLVTEAMIDTFFVAGTPERCRDRMAAIYDLAREHGFHQLMFSELGPDPVEGLSLLSGDMLPGR
jgi:5,10-methylenetetrahydromethanopterin reductase